MKEEILFDTRWIGQHGIGRFAEETFKRLGFKQFNPNHRLLSPFDSLRTSIQLKKIKPAHYFTPGFNPLIGNPCQYSMTIHDLIHIYTKEATPAKKIFYETLIKPSIKKAEIIFTVSQFSKESICDWAKIPEEKVVVAGNGISQNYNPNGERYEHQKPYILYIGNRKPHKNLELLFDSFLSSTLPKDFDLAISGPPPRINQALSAGGRRESIIGLGNIPEDDLPKIYRGATAFIMPSLYEGFGLPVIEAMACGTPVLSSNKTCLPEIGGDAAIYFDASRKESFIHALEKARDKETMTRHSLLGLKNSQRFSWEDVALRIAQKIKN